jgi:hypothetical protein
MNTRDNSAGEASGVCCGVDADTFSIGGCWPEIAGSFGVCWLDTVEPSGVCWPKIIEPLDANKPNPSERANAEGNNRLRGPLVIESLNLFSIFVFYLLIKSIEKCRDVTRAV